MTKMTPEQISKLLKEHPEIVDWKVELQYPVNDPIYPKGLLKLSKLNLSEEERESLCRTLENTEVIPILPLPPYDNGVKKATVKDIDSETVETMLTVILDEIRQLREAIKGKKEVEG